MNGHFVGEGGFLAAGAPTTGETSLAVRQFCAFAFGWVPPHAPSQPWKLVRVTAEEQYCLRCCGVRVFDVLTGDERRTALCRCCGNEVKHG